MKYSFQFSNLLGTVYAKGNVEFLSGNDTLVSPVGNRATLFNLKDNNSSTLPITTKCNIAHLAFSPDDCMAIAIDEEGEASLISLLSKTIIHRFKFRSPVTCIKYSPDGKRFAVATDRTVLVYYSPGKTRELNPFTLNRSYHGAYDDVTCIDWTSDSNVFAAGSKDMNTKVYGARKFQNLHVYSLGGHKDEIMGCFFQEDSLDLYTVCRSGSLNVWECDTDLDQLMPMERKEVVSYSAEDPMETGNITENDRTDDDHQLNNINQTKPMEKVNYSRLSKYFYNKEGDFNSVTAVAFHKPKQIIVTGFASGAFYLHELPNFNLIHSLSISEQHISTACFNKSGDWLALGCSGLGQLLVWEWQSETYILKQHGHFNNMTSLDYSPDGRYIVTGGEDSKVKVWDTSSGFCFVTFIEHKAPVTDVTFTSSGYVIVSASLDGTVRAFDMHRYRNFRTFTSPKPVQFVCLAVDHSGEMVSAGSHDTFEIYLWTMRTGHLLDILSGHEAPVTSIAFSKQDALLVSGSWDGLVKLWNVIDGKGARETLQIGHDVLAVAFNPNGKEIAVSSLNAEITIWDVQHAVQKGSIECRHDMGAGRGELDRVSSKTKVQGKSFDTISYTADGQAIIAGGKCLNICLYSVKECLLLKRFKVSQNLSFDSVEEFLNKRKMTEFGPSALIDMGESEQGVSIKLPGVKKGEMCGRAHKPEVRVTAVRFSPSGREWAATTTEGLLIYSLDASMVFDPFDLEVEINPEAINHQLAMKEYGTAIMMAFRLNENPHITRVIESVPADDIDIISKGLSLVYVEKLLEFVARRLEKSRHANFYLLWCKCLLIHHSVHLKPRSNKVMHTLNHLSKALTVKVDQLGKLCDTNKYQMEYILATSVHLCQKRQKIKPDTSEEDSNVLFESDQET